MSQKTRLALDTNPPGFIRRCVACSTRITPGKLFYRDLGSEDDLCDDCGDYFVAQELAVIVSSSRFTSSLDEDSEDA